MRSSGECDPPVGVRCQVWECGPSDPFFSFLYLYFSHHAAHSIETKAKIELGNKVKNAEKDKVNIQRSEREEKKFASFLEGKC